MQTRKTAGAAGRARLMGGREGHVCDATLPTERHSGRVTLTVIWEGGIAWVGSSGLGGKLAVLGARVCGEGSYPR
eukprot:173788-Rhodomonas_salina.1